MVNIENMKVEETDLLDCYILEPKRFGDNRGYFESVTEKQLNDLGFNKLTQISNSMSEKGVLRGLHFQRNPYCQTKVVRCHRGSVLDVVVDMRIDSKTYGKFIMVELTSENGRMLYVPRGFAHAYLSLEDNSLFEYYVDNCYMPSYEDGILWNDSALGIPWDEIKEKYEIEEFKLSDKDVNRYTLADCNTIFKREKTRYLITGYRGQLGFDIVRELENRGENCYLALDVNEMDITNRDKVFEVINDYRPDVIFHCAAYTAVDKAEEDFELARKINVEGTKNIVDASIAVGSKIFYMSTDYVFDGEKDGLYKENDLVNPINEYGKTKYQGEEEVRRNSNHFIMRISWVFGINGANFIRTMLNQSLKRSEITVVDDQFGSPTYTVDLAKLLVEMSYTTKYGTYHANNDEYCSWAEFAKYIYESNGIDMKVIPISTEEYQKNIPGQAKRPKNSKLSKEKLISEGFSMLPSWKDATDRYCVELKKQHPALHKIKRK